MASPGQLSLLSSSRHLQRAFGGNPGSCGPPTGFPLEPKGIPYLKKSPVALLLWEMLICLGGGEAAGCPAWGGSLTYVFLSEYVCENV